MPKILSVEEALNEMKAVPNEKGELVINRFNKRKFETLMLAMANDLELSTETVKIHDGEPEVSEIAVTKGFRKFCRKLLESAGMDRSEAARIESGDFIIQSVEGLYDFFTDAMYRYMEVGNRFDLPSKKDFKGGMILVDVDEVEKEYKAKDIKTGKVTDKKINKKTKKHKRLKAKSNAPSYLSEKRFL